MKKEDILKILQDGWEGYKTRILPNSYLYLYNDGQGIKTKQVAVRDFNFLHLSGVKSRLSAEIFTRKLRKKALRQYDFYVVDKSCLSNKLMKLTELPDVVEQAHKIGSRLQDLKNVDYLIGKNDVILGLAKSENGRGADTPSSLMSGDWNKMATNSCDILAILRMPKQGKRVYDKVTYCKQGAKIDVQQLPESIKKLCSDEVLTDLSNGKQSDSIKDQKTQEIKAGKISSDREREYLTQADKEIIDRIRKSKSGKEYSDLEAGKYSGNKESADMKMMRILAFFTDCDTSQMERIFKSTNLYEPAKGNAYVDKLKTTAVKADREPKPNQKNVKRISSKSTGRSK